MNEQLKQAIKAKYKQWCEETGWAYSNAKNVPEKLFAKFLLSDPEIMAGWESSECT